MSSSMKRPVGISSQKTNEKPVEVSPTVIETKVEIEKTSPSVIYKVQLSASKKKLELVPKNFKGLINVTMTSEGNMNKYMYGETSNYEEAKKILEEAKSKGYTSAYLIAMKNGEMISLQEANK